MSLRHKAVRLLPVLAVLIAVVVPADAALAAAPADKPAVLLSWTQPTAGAYTTWNAARQNQAAWAVYEFDWTTDLCSTSPDQPAGFDFRLPCQHHDFGYRNYQAAGAFAANKVRLDDMFYGDLSRKCDTYNSFVRPACDSLAWTYYQAAKALGTPAISTAELRRVERMKATAERAAAAR